LGKADGYLKELKAKKKAGSGLVDGF